MLDRNKLRENFRDSVVIPTVTQEDFTEILQAAKEVGINITTMTPKLWDSYKKDTCVHNNGGNLNYCNRNYYEKSFNIVEISEFQHKNYEIF